MLETELELCKLGVPVKTRHNEVAPGQYEIAPIFENSNVGSDHQQLTMQVLQNVARRYGLVCLLHEKPFAGVNGSGKHNNWSMGTDTGDNLLDPGDTPAENVHFLFFCAAVIQAVNKHQGLLRASVAEHRPGPPPRRQRGAAGDHLDLPRRRAGQGLRGDRQRRGRPAHAGRVPRPRARRSCRRCRCTAATATAPRRSPSPATSSSSARVGSSMSLAFPNTVLNTIVAESIDDLADKLEAKIERRQGPAEAAIEVVKETYDANKQICFGGDNYAEEWHAEAEKRGLKNLKTTPDALPEVLGRRHGRGVREVQRALQARARVPLRGLGRAVRDPRQHRGGDGRLDRQDDDPAGGAALPGADRRGRRLRARGRGARAGRRAGRRRSTSSRRPTSTPTARGPRAGRLRPRQADRRDGEVREVADKLEKVVADDLWPLPKYSEMLFIK